MSIQKPLPLMVGNKAYYSLTSYDPVEITVDVPYTSEEDVQYALEMSVADVGGTLKDLDNPDWVAEHFPGLTTRQQVVDALRQQIQLSGNQIAEQQKLGKCVEALSSRLAQSVPPQHIEEARDALRMRFVQQLQAEGLTPEQFMMRSGTTAAQLDNMFSTQAVQLAEGDAALSAYAHEKKLKVSEEEYGRLLGIPADELQDMISQARAAGQMDEMREAALRAKAAQIVVAECSCTYNHETPEHARARMAQFRQMEQMYAQRFEDDESQDEEPEAGKTGFKLV